MFINKTNFLWYLSFFTFTIRAFLYKCGVTTSQFIMSLENILYFFWMLRHSLVSVTETIEYVTETLFISFVGRVLLNLFPRGFVTCTGSLVVRRSDVGGEEDNQIRKLTVCLTYRFVSTDPFPELVSGVLFTLYLV